MALQMACWHSAEVTGAVAIAAGRAAVLDKYADESMNSMTPYSAGCPAENGGPPSNVLIVHDPADLVVGYDLAIDNFDFWARVNQCDRQQCPSARGSLDLLPHLKGIQAMVSKMRFGTNHPNETLRYAYEGCDAGGDTELWAVETWWSDIVNPQSGLPGYPTVFLEPNSGLNHAPGHFNSWAVANDHGEHFALIHELLRWLIHRQSHKAERAVRDGVLAKEDLFSAGRRAGSAIGALDEETRRLRRLKSKMLARPSWENITHIDCPHVLEFIEDWDSSIAAYLFAALFLPVMLILCAMVEGCWFSEVLKQVRKKIKRTPAHEEKRAG